MWSFFDIKYKESNIFIKYLCFRKKRAVYKAVN